MKYHTSIPLPHTHNNHPVETIKIKVFLFNLVDSTSRFFFLLVSIQNWFLYYKILVKQYVTHHIKSTSYLYNDILRQVTRIKCFSSGIGKGCHNICYFAVSLQYSCMRHLWWHLVFSCLCNIVVCTTYDFPQKPAIAQKFKMADLDSFHSIK